MNFTEEIMQMQQQNPLKEHLMTVKYVKEYEEDNFPSQKWVT